MVALPFRHRAGVNVRTAACHYRALLDRDSPAAVFESGTDKGRDYTVLSVLRQERGISAGLSLQSEN